MTSQVAIFNLNGIAVASDTVSTSRSDKGSKTTNNAEKIYPLGEGHLVVALHFGGTGLNDLNHQFHFNRWRESLGKPLPTLEDYLNDYVEWSTKNRLHSDESENVEVIAIIYDHVEELLRRTQKDIENASSENAPANFTDFLFQRLSFHTKAGLDYLKELPKIKGITLESAKQTIADRKIDVKKVFFDAAKQFWAFDNLIKLPANIAKLLSQSASLSLTVDQPLFWDSSLVFVGYGTKESFGSSIQVRVRSIIDNRLIYSRGEVQTIEPGRGQSRISAFAQSDAINSFVQGYNWDIMSEVTWAIRNRGREVLPDAITDEYLEKIADATQEYIEGHSWKFYISPMLNQIASMNLFSMSELARTLVGLQATSSEAKDGPASVGGLIEVLTIDRTNGVQWRSKLP